MSVNTSLDESSMSEWVELYIRTMNKKDPDHSTLSLRTKRRMADLYWLEMSRGNNMDCSADAAAEADFQENWGDDTDKLDHPGP